MHNVTNSPIKSLVVILHVMVAPAHYDVNGSPYILLICLTTGKLILLKEW